MDELMDDCPYCFEYVVAEGDEGEQKTCPHCGKVYIISVETIYTLYRIEDY